MTVINIIFILTSIAIIIASVLFCRSDPKQNNNDKIDFKIFSSLTPAEIGKEFVKMVESGYIEKITITNSGEPFNDKESAEKFRLIVKNHLIRKYLINITKK